MSGTGPHYYPSQGGVAGPQHYYGSADETGHFTRPPPAYVGDDETLLRGGIPRGSIDEVCPPPPHPSSC
jgi:hypothetical protein